MNKEYVQTAINCPMTSQITLNSKRSVWSESSLRRVLLDGRSLKKFILHAFDWSRSLQGDIYWRSWYDGEVELPSRSMWTSPVSDD